MCWQPPCDDLESFDRQLINGFPVINIGEYYTVRINAIRQVMMSDSSLSGLTGCHRRVPRLMRKYAGKEAKVLRAAGLLLIRRCASH